MWPTYIEMYAKESFNLICRSTFPCYGQFVNNSIYSSIFYLFFSETAAVFAGTSSPPAHPERYDPISMFFRYCLLKNIGKSGWWRHHQNTFFSYQKNRFWHSWNKYSPQIKAQITLFLCRNRLRNIRGIRRKFVHINTTITLCPLASLFSQ